MLDLNLTAPFRCVRRAVPAMRAAGWGRVVVIASSAAHVGEPYIAAYTASKHGVLGLVRSAAAELARDGCHGQRGLPRLRGHPDDRRDRREHRRQNRPQRGRSARRRWRTSSPSAG